MVLRETVIQNEGVLSLVKRSVLLSTLGLAFIGCAHREDVHVDSVPSVPVTSTQRESDEREVIAVENQPPAQQAPAARPRLSQTVTLGEQQAYAPQPVPTVQGQGQAPAVIVNNYNVQQAPPAVYGGYGYGYGGGSFYGNRATTFNDGRGGSSSRGTPQWGSSGWEGARRTAAPGQTPGVGGNWAPVPSYGPSQMK